MMSSPAPPQIRSFPSPPSIWSLPPRAWITSSPEVPTMTSSPSVPTIVATRSPSPTHVTTCARAVPASPNNEISMTTPAAQAAAVFAEIERIPFLSSPERGGLMVMNRPRCLRCRPSGASGVERLGFFIPSNPRSDEAWKGLRPTKDFLGPPDRREGEVKRGRLQAIDLGGKHVEDVPDVRLELREDLWIEILLLLGIVSDDQGRHHYAPCGVRIHSREGEDGPFVNHPLQPSLDGPGREAQLLRHGRVWFLRVSSEGSNHVPI